MWDILRRLYSTSHANANTITRGASDEWNLRSVNPHSHVHPSITSMDAKIDTRTPSTSMGKRAHRPSLGFPFGLVQHEPHPGIPYASQEVRMAPAYRSADDSD